MSHTSTFDVFDDLAASASDKQPQHSREGEHPLMLPEPTTGNAATSNLGLKTLQGRPSRAARNFTPFGALFLFESRGVSEVGRGLGPNYPPETRHASAWWRADRSTPAPIRSCAHIRAAALDFGPETPRPFATRARRCPVGPSG